MGFMDIVLMVVIIGRAFYILYRSVWKKKGLCRVHSFDSYDVDTHPFQDESRPGAQFAGDSCTRICIYFSLVLLFVSIGYELNRIGGLAAAGAVLIAGLSFREGREAFEKAKGKSDCGCQCCH